VVEVEDSINIQSLKPTWPHHSPKKSKKHHDTAKPIENKMTIPEKKPVSKKQPIV
jgi:hypothetical protein